MRIHVGCKLRFEFSQATPMIATLNVHFSRVSDLERPDYLITDPSVPIEGYRDSFGNWCNRLVAPSGHFSLGTDAIIRDSGLSDPINLNALQHQVEHLPAEVILFLLGSRYCETDRLSDEAWRLFGNSPLGWPRGYLRLRAQSHNLRLRALARNQNGIRSIPRTPRCLPRLRASCSRLLPLPEHPGALLHRLHH
jgi:hypothetical protein